MSTQERMSTHKNAKGNMRHRKALKERLVATLAVCCSVAVMLSVGSSTASAQVASPAWSIDSFSTPSVFSSSDTTACIESVVSVKPGCDVYHVTVDNVGSRAADGSPVEIKDVLSGDVEVQKVVFEWTGTPQAFGGPTTNLANFGLCSTSGTPVTVVCRLSTSELELENGVAPDDLLKVGIYVTVPKGGSNANSEAMVSGGGGGSASTGELSTSIEGEPVKFGPSAASVLDAGLGGKPDREAGGHPYEFSTRVDLNTVKRQGPSGAFTGTSVEDLKDVVVDLPLGFVGSATATPTCKLSELSSVSVCPTDTEIGHLRTEPDDSAVQVNGPIYNLVPEQGYAAEFGFDDALKNGHVITARVVNSPSGYIVQAEARDIPQIGLTSIITTFWGEPARKNGSNATGGTAMFTNPTSCNGEPLVTGVSMDSWQHPGPRNGRGEPELGGGGWVSTDLTSPSMTECNLLQFSSVLSPSLETSNADSPTGFDVGIEVPQQEAPGVRATPTLRTTAVQLPPGLTLDPAAAAGLQTCTEAQIALSNMEPPACPDASKVGTVEVTTPLLAHSLPGSIYLAAQNENPSRSAVAAYVVVDDPATGVLVKIPGRIEVSEAGVVRGVFDQLPQLPFSDLKLHFFGGSHGDLMTPESCGLYGVDGTFTPWSTPLSEEAAGNVEIGSRCSDRFAPTFQAGTVSPTAGAYSPFVLSYGREDEDQELSGLTVSLPQGLLAKLAGVGQCSDAALAAAAGRTGRAEQASPSCPAASAVGDVNVQAGPGPTPFEVSGHMYLTGPYKGAPYGLAVVVPAIAGPYDFGTVVVRQALEVDPLDAHATVVSDPFPSVLRVRGADGVVDGFPLRIRKVTATIDRPDFTINPTDCHEKAIGGVGTSSGGVAVALKSRFQASDCASLGFRPKFVVSTSGKTSKARGASLNVKLTYPQGPQGTYANIARVKVDLPKQLPSQLKTLQKACTAAQFNANPAGCPAESKVGFATVHTPILAAPLSGPAIFVSHGNEAFPSLTMVLQGDNVTLDLVGTTFISKAGITSSTFKAVPDAPVSSFELNLPQGKYSALTANGNLCKSKLAMPTEFLAQNGAKINESTKISVTGCPRVKKAKAKKRAAKSKRKAHSKG
jgi:hypothetical protein